MGNDYFKKLPNNRNGGHVPGRPGKVPGRSRTGPRDPEGPGTKKSQDLKSPKVLGLENGKVPEKMTSLVPSGFKRFGLLGFMKSVFKKAMSAGLKSL